MLPITPPPLTPAAVLNHKLGGFSIDTPARVTDAASAGINFTIDYGEPASPTSAAGQRLLPYHMKVIDGFIASNLYYYACHKDFNQALLADPYTAWGPKELIAIAFEHQPYCPHGKGSHYSNTNYLLLGMLIEQIAGMPVEKIFQQYLFRPLGRVGSRLPPRTSPVIPDSHPHGYARLPGTGPRDVTEWNPSWAWTAGSRPRRSMICRSGSLVCFLQTSVAWGFASSIF